MSSSVAHWKYGVRDGIPICLGYLAVSFTFGIVARNAGITPTEAVLMSVTNLASAGQFAGVGLIGASATYVEMAVTQLVINLRYCLMAASLSQKFSSSTPFSHRFLVAFGISDEIYGLSVIREGDLRPAYNYGLMSVCIPGWTLGTLLGVISGSLLPANIVSALSIALFGMFIAVIIPPAKGNKRLSGIILLSMAVSLLFAEIPGLSGISSGFRTIILTVVIAGIAAAFLPVKKTASEEDTPGELSARPGRLLSPNQGSYE